MNLPREALLSPPRLSWPLVLLGVLLLAIVGVLLLAEHVVGAPARDVELLALFLSASGGLSLLIGALAIRWLGQRLGSLRQRLALASGVGLVIALVNVLTTSALMFLSPHDLTLLLLLLSFAAVVSLAFAYAVAGTLTSEISALSRTAQRLAEGDFSARVGVHGPDEVGRLAAVLDDMAERLQDAFDRERALEAGRRELVTAVSHDLRTPLATTRAMVEALADGVVADPAEVQRYLALILREIQHLSRLIDDLFELNQIESGSLRLRLEPLDVSQLLAETIGAYEAPAAEHGVSLEECVAPDCEGLALEADANRLQRVLRNLLDNALSHTPSGGHVELTASRIDAELDLVVADSGPGVPTQELERIFERFYRGEASRRREGAVSTGAGLGLAIARGLVQAHHGRIWAERSRLGGLSIRIRLPTAS
ncbi:MAG: HAMP domain-containing protein [Chloroflexi bacterium]|nr:HAMP domain-containing protein [Chloroflexota bacterium]MBV9546544.1 HAMP domain-containing protein [Chloroflexota bacterium]